MSHKRLFLVLLLILPAVIQIAQIGKPLVLADEDEIESEDDGAVEDEEADGEADQGDSEDEGEFGEEKKNVSPFVETTLFFTRPPQNLASGNVELPAGSIVEFLVGFENQGEEDFVVDNLNASFRYPMDFSYIIRNFTVANYHKTVKPSQEAALHYYFMPADAFAGRSIGLTIGLSYRDSEGNFYFDPVFNETVQIVELDEGFDTEIFFMYVFLVAVLVLLLFLAYSFLSGGSKSKKTQSSHKPVDIGTTNDDVDYEWIPKSALRTPGSNKTSPRQRRDKKRAGASSDTE